MNIILSSDDNYAPFLGVLLHSIINSNLEEIVAREKIVTFYVLDMNISNTNKERMMQLLPDKYVKIKFIDTAEIQSDLEKKVKAPVRSLATYYRLFLPSLLPLSVEKIIYLDCDGFVDGSLFELWDTPISGYDIAGVLDVMIAENKTRVGMKPTDDYVNAGVLLVNLKRWRERNIEQKFVDLIEKYDGQVCYHDQGAINAVCKDKLIVHPKYNAMTPLLTMTRKQLLGYHGVQTYYPQTVLSEARIHPVFVHLVPSLTDRPWIKGNFHPFRKRYNELMNETPWKGTVVNQHSKVLDPWVRYLYHYTPYWLFISILRTLQNFKPRTWYRQIRGV